MPVVGLAHAHARMGKAGKKRKLSAPSHDEVSGYAETETLFKSNLFRLQTAELLREVAPFSAPLTRLEGALRALRTQLLALPSTELYCERQPGAAPPKVSHPHLKHLVLANESVRMAWRAPARVDLVGSYLLRTTTAPELNVDVSIELPASMLLEKDYLDQRYADKRLLYLTHLAHVLGTAASAAGSGGEGSVVSTATPPRFVALPHMQAHNWPVLELTLTDGSAGGKGAAASAAAPPKGKKAKAAEAAAKGGAEVGVGGSEIRGWSVRLVPSLADEALPAGKLKPQRCNLRCLGARPSAVYNNLLRLESSHAKVRAPCLAPPPPPWRLPRRLRTPAPARHGIARQAARTTEFYPCPTPSGDALKRQRIISRSCRAFQAFRGLPRPSVAFHGLAAWPRDLATRARLRPSCASPPLCPPCRSSPCCTPPSRETALARCARRPCCSKCGSVSATSAGSQEA